MRHSRVAFGMMLIVIVVVLGTWQQGRLHADAAVAPAKIGVVNVTQVLENSAKHKQLQEKMQNDRAAMEAEFKKMKDELDAAQANLKLRTPGSEDALRLQGELLEKKALMDAKYEFYRSKVETEMQRWTESLYQKMLTVIKNVAEAKGLDMVIADEILDLPAPTLRDFMLTVKTKKMLYYKSQYDLTAEVQAALDKAD
ncbi:MAG: OmpH family outer membrane protein [Planctomycetales bacterium]|nr:OmpH family outer membrane protein [Planctomycetales bacterium]